MVHKMKIIFWICLIFLVSLILLHTNEGARANSGTRQKILKTIPVEEAKELFDKNRDNPDFIILDIRTPQEYESGHLEDAINIDYYDENFREELDGLDKSKTYLMHCRSGGRSGRALQIMKELNFEEVYDMAGGILGWQDQGFPVVK